jgi:hypothetical protein
MRTVRILCFTIGLALIIYNISQWMVYPPTVPDTNPDSKLVFYIRYDKYFLIGFVLLFIAWLINRSIKRRKRFRKLVEKFEE